MMPRTDTGPPTGVADNANIAVFEGQGRVVTVLTVAGAVLDGATVSADDDGLRVIEHVCAGSRCGVVLAVDDVLADVGRPVPAPIDATNRFLRIRLDGAPDRRALFSVAPLDAIRNDGEATVRGTYFASSVTTSVATAFRGAAGLEPIRWFVFGDAVLHGEVDVSGSAQAAGPGGEPGADAAASGEGEGAGGSGSTAAGGGGGGSFEAGTPGEGAGAGEGGEPFAPGCAHDPFVRDCGGGAGGGATGSGGGGGGAFSIAVLGTLDVDVDLIARGGDGVDGGGGGGGGRLFVGASVTTGPGARADVAGGAGGMRAGAAGGAGGAGEARLVADGPMVDTPASWIVRDPSISISGRARAGSSIEVSRLDDTVVATGLVATDGTFALSVTLDPGLNRLRIVEIDAGGERRRSWSGNHFELERRGVEVLPVGALLDVAYLP